MQRFNLTRYAASLLSFTLLSACSSQQEDAKNTQTAEQNVVTLITRDNPPLPQIAEFVRDKVKQDNIDLRIEYATDGLVPNKSVSDQDMDLNYFQHRTYMQSAKEINNWDLHDIATTFNSIFGAYSSRFKNLADLPDGAKVVIPSDPSNGGRALNLLATAGLIQFNSNRILAPKPALKILPLILRV